MSVYLITRISGNENFGGYLSIDGGKSGAIENGEFIRLSPGQHSLQIHSTSDAQRGIGNAQAFLYRNTSSSGVLGDALERQSARSNLGESWDINVYVEDDQVVYLNVLTKGQKIIDDPIYKVEDMSEEMKQELDAKQQELEEKYEEWINTPVRSKKLMIWGGVLAFFGVFGLANYLSSGGMQDSGMGGALVLGLFILVGAWMIYSGAKKKIRRK